jgi:hypothetical protein
MRKCADRTDAFTVNFPGVGGVHFVATSVAEELASEPPPEEVPKLPYLSAVISETLRMAIGTVMRDVTLRLPASERGRSLPAPSRAGSPPSRTEKSHSRSPNATERTLHGAVAN